MRFNHVIRARLLIGSMLAAGLALPAQAYAQDVSAEAAGGGLEEIVVTAQRRAENLQDVPIAVSAMSSEALQNTGISLRAN